MSFIYSKLKETWKSNAISFVKRYKQNKDGELEKQLLIFARYQKLVNESK